MQTDTKSRFTYFNHKGLVEERVVELTSLDYIPKPRNDFNHQPGWFLTGLDYSRGRNGDVRSFQLSSIQMPENGFNHDSNIPSFRIPFPTRSLKREIAALETVNRPEWAQGNTTDSVAAQKATSALTQLWELIGAENQTEAIEILRAIIKS